MENIKYILRLYKNCLFINSRYIMTTQRTLEKALENLQNNPYYNKYADRIAQLQKTSPEEFLQRVEHQQKFKGEEKKKKFASLDTRQFSSALNPKPAVPEESSGEVDKLDSIFKTELVKDKDAAEIRVIWEEYHKQKPVISAAIPADVYTTIKQLMRAHNTFLFPLPRDHGYEFVVSQTAGHCVHFTPLLAYQVHKENAPECLKMVHFVELADKGLVLMRGEYDKNVLDGEEARCLANQFQLYYGGRDPAKLRLLESFSTSPEAFKHMDLISQLENITVS